MKANLLSWFETLMTKIAVMRALLATTADGADPSRRDEAERAALRGPFF